MSDRKQNIEWYNKEKTESEEENAVLCNKIADESLYWNPSEAVFWRKKAIEIAENLYGKDSLKVTVYYDGIVNDYLEKGSYKEGIKWNKKSKKIKEKHYGENSRELLTSLVFDSHLYSCLEKYEEAEVSIKKTIFLLEKYCSENSMELYQIYLEMMNLESGYNLYAKRTGKEELKDIEECADKAINIAMQLFGEESLEIAIAYCDKAVLAYKNQREKRICLLKKALLIAIRKQGMTGEDVKMIFYHIRRYWLEQDMLKEWVIWTCDNVSKEFMQENMVNYPEDLQAQIKEVLENI